MRTDSGTGYPPDRSPDDDSTVYADEDMIRQIRAANDEVASPSTESNDADDTIFADDDLIREIRVAAGGSGPAAAFQEAEDATVFADDDLIRRIRIASETEAPSEPAPEIPTGTDTVVSPTGSEESGGRVEEDRTIVVGDDVIRALRIGGASLAASPGEPADFVRQPHNDASSNRVDNVARPEVNPTPTPPPDALEELRKRFAPEASASTGTLIPPWLIITGVTALVILGVIVLAVIFVG